MSWKLKRFFRNLLYKLRIPRLPRTLSLRPLLALVLLAFSIFILAGGLYDIIEGLTGRLQYLLPTSKGGYTFLYPGTLQQQTLNESIAVAAIYFMGVAGIYMLIRGTRLIYKPRSAYMLLMLSLVITLAAVFLPFIIIQWKTGG